MSVVPASLEGLTFHVAAGVKPIGEPRDRPWGERTFNVRDPDGNLLEFQ